LQGEIGGARGRGMKLTDYLTAQGETQTAFGLRAGISIQHVNQICSGKKCPSLRVAFRIVNATGSAVDFADLIVFENDEPPLPEPPAPEAAE